MSATQQASTAQGVGSELDVIASVVVGGASLFGGEGTILGTLLGTVWQGLDWVRRHCNFLSESQKAMVLGETARRVYNFDA